MTEVSPAYYAELRYQKATFDIAGKYFNQIPSDAVGILSQRNDEPLANIASENTAFIVGIVSKTDREMVLEHGEKHDISAIYLGGIVSRDRQTVYWVNESRPLPD